MKNLPLIAGLPALLLVAGCSGPSYTIAQLGHQVFEPAVGKDTLFERADPNQRGNLDAFPEEASDDADHRFLVSFLPAGSEERVGVEVRAHVKGKLGFRLLASAAYPLSRQEAARFSATGELPKGAEPLGVETESEEDEVGWRVLHLIFDRKKIPAGAEMLAVPTLAQFKDGWISVRFYTTRVPEPLKMLTAEEIKQFRRRQAREDPAATPPAETASPRPEKP
jgi:hypothetical protein